MTTMNQKLLSLSVLPAIVILLLASCGGQSKKKPVTADTIALAPCPRFQADSAMLYIHEQCSFGPRVTGSDAAQRCGDYIAERFKAFGAEVEEQTGDVTVWDGSKLPARNIIARIPPRPATDGDSASADGQTASAPNRILLCAHWDSRPWADQDANTANQRQPILGANDGASGVAVMIEVARVLSLSADSTLPAVDFVCFDAEDCGTPEWDEQRPDHETTWCLGSQHWASQPHATDYAYGILLDMVGGRGARFFREGYSMQYAAQVVNRVWSAARQAGYSDYFPNDDSGYITDDHLFVNRLARIPMIDIVPYHPIGDHSFGPTWHTLQDSPDNIAPATLKAVGQTLLQLIFTETN